MMKNVVHPRDPRHHPRYPARGFTLVELIVAGVIATMVVGSIGISLGQMGQARNKSKRHLTAILRADAALNEIRRSIVSVVRSDDLFYTRLLILDDSSEEFDFDEIALFNTRLRPVRNTESYTGEGIEYETQFRIEGDTYGTALWQRRDVLPDEYPLGGGEARVVADGIVSLSIEAYDGMEWYGEWDSDITGLPLAVRILITASGHRDLEDPYDAPLVDLRTVIAIDRVAPPRDLFEAEEALLDEQMAEDLAEAAEEAADTEDETGGGSGTGAAPGGGGRPDVGGNPGGTPPGQGPPNIGDIPIPQ